MLTEMTNRQTATATKSRYSFTSYVKVSVRLSLKVRGFIHATLSAVVLIEACLTVSTVAHRFNTPNTSQPLMATLIKEDVRISNIENRSPTDTVPPLRDQHVPLLG
jgi:hypothetical protein